jgi:cell division septal protein FtsQ
MRTGIGPPNSRRSMDSKVRERRRLVKRERGRRRAGLIFLGVLAVVAAIAFLWLRSSSVFAVRDITASPTKHVTEQQLAEAVAGARGVSLLKVSTGAIQQSLAALPYVRSVHVYRHFPDGLEVQVEEYRPAARVQTGDGKMWLVADSGRLLEKIPASGSSPLPLVVSTTQFEARAGGSVPQVVLAAVPVAQLLETQEIASQLPAVEDVSVSTGGEVVVHLEGGTELRLGEPTDLKQKITYAARIIQDWLRDGKSLEYVDVSAADHPAVKPK